MLIIKMTQGRELPNLEKLSYPPGYGLNSTTYPPSYGLNSTITVLL